jgi:hypothetical protein
MLVFKTQERTRLAEGCLFGGCGRRLSKVGSQDRTCQKLRLQPEHKLTPGRVSTLLDLVPKMKIGYVPMLPGMLESMLVLSNSTTARRGGSEWLDHRESTTSSAAPPSFVFSHDQRSTCDFNAVILQKSRPARNEASEHRSSRHVSSFHAACLACRPDDHSVPAQLDDCELSPGVGSIVSSHFARKLRPTHSPHQYRLLQPDSNQPLQRPRTPPK